MSSSTTLVTCMEKRRRTVRIEGLGTNKITLPCAWPEARQLAISRDRDRRYIGCLSGCFAYQLSVNCKQHTEGEQAALLLLLWSAIWNIKRETINPFFNVVGKDVSFRCERWVRFFSVQRLHFIRIENFIFKCWEDGSVAPEHDRPVGKMFGKLIYQCCLGMHWISLLAIAGVWGTLSTSPPE